MKFLSGTITRSSDSMDAFANTLSSSLAATTSSTSTTVANSGLSVTLVASATYLIRGVVIYQCGSTTTGAKIGFACGHIAAGAINLRVPNSAGISATFVEQAATTTNTVAGNNVAVANTSIIVFVEGVATMDSTGGNLNIQFGSTVSGQSTTLQVGSMLVAERLA